MDELLDFRRTPGYYELRCGSYKKQVLVPVQTYHTRDLFKLPAMKEGKIFRTYLGEFLI